MAPAIPISTAISNRMNGEAELNAPADDHGPLTPGLNRINCYVYGMTTRLSHLETL